jgi:hypothetical protein
MKRLFLTLCILLAGCGTTAPVVMKFPNVPKDMLVTCPDLKSTDETIAKLSEVINVVVENYATYYDCKASTDNWIEWYNTQKKIFESIK